MAYKYCQECDECTYIGEGDYACMKEEPKIILTEHVIPTNDFGWCNSYDETMEEANRMLAEDKAKRAERRKQRGKIKKRGTGTKTAQTKQSKQNQLLYK